MTDLPQLEALAAHQFYYRLADTVDPEERLEDAALWKAMHDEFGETITVLPPEATKPRNGVLFGRSRKSEVRSLLRYWEDPAFLENCGRRFTLSTIEGVDEAVHELHADGYGAFLKSTRDKHWIATVPVGIDPVDVIGDMAYSFIDGGPLLMVQELAEITYEWRFFVIDRTVVTHSPNAAHLTPIDYPLAHCYRRPSDTVSSGSPLALLRELRPLAWRIAEKMATRDAVIDLALINGKPGCVEFNPMIAGNVGLFACDVRAIARAFRARALETRHGG